MEGVAGGGGGDGLASGSVRASDLDIFRDNPDAAASRAAPGRVDLPVSAGGPRRQAPHARPPESPTMHHAPPPGHHRAAGGALTPQVGAQLDPGARNMTDI